MWCPPKPQAFDRLVADRQRELHERGTVDRRHLPRQRGPCNLHRSRPACRRQKITAVYQGDDNFEAASSTPAAVNSAVSGVPAFTLTASNSSLSVVAGSTATTVITATPENGFNQAVSLSCSGVPYVTVTCVFSPAQVTPGAPTATNPNGTPVISTLSIVTTAYNGGELREPGLPPGLSGSSDTVYAVAAPGILALAGLGLTRRRWAQGKLGGTAKMIAILFLLLASGIGLSSCSQRYGYFHRPPSGQSRNSRGDVHGSHLRHHRNGQQLVHRERVGDAGRKNQLGPYLPTTPPSHPPVGGLPTPALPAPPTGCANQA